MSSTACLCTTPSTSVAGTLTGGIQDTAALLPLLGTEQCEDHVSSALTNGYLYAAAAPMSLFGSLGLARAGLKIFVASFSIPAWNVVGARTLANMGFKPQGMNLSLIMVDPSDQHGRYLAEIRLEKLVDELHIDPAKVRDVQHRTIGWNLRMVALSSALCLLSLIPYVFLNVKTRNKLPHGTRWTFPALRAVGGFLTTVMIQFVIQRRTTTLTRKWISEHCSNETTVKGTEKPTDENTYDVERNPRVLVSDGNSPLTWFLLLLLLLGVLASIVGYVGCFSVVQSADGSTGPLSWLCLESGLSLLRMFLWGYNPAFDDAPPLELILARDPYPPLPTCNLYKHDIEREKLLPLTRANQFLDSITAFTGAVDRFEHPDVTLYYTLTRNAVPHADSHHGVLHDPGEHVLYITIFDHKERANTRVYVQHSGADHFYGTESALPVIDLKQGLLEITLGDEIENKDDPIIGDDDLRSKLSIHYQSIMSQMYFAMRQPQWIEPSYRIENKWTMAQVHTTKCIPRSGEGDLIEDYTRLRTPSLRDFQYFQHGRLQKICQSFCAARGEWIATYMNWGIQEMRERFRSQDGTTMFNCVDDMPTRAMKTEGKSGMLAGKAERQELPPPVTPMSSDQEDIENQVVDGIRCMELLLAQEIEIWEQHIWDQANKFIRRHDILEKTRLAMEWNRGFRTRLDTDIRTMETRLDTAELGIGRSHSDNLRRKWHSMREDIRKAWQALIKPPTLSSPPTNPSSLEGLQTEFQQSSRHIETVIEWSQLNAAQREQLLQQTEVVDRSRFELQEAVFWMDDPLQLLDYRLSRSKWARLDLRSRSTMPLGVYLRALALGDIIFIAFNHFSSDSDYALVAELITHLSPSVTSIFVPDLHRLPAIQRGAPLFINDSRGSSDVETFLHDSQSQLERNRLTHVFIDTGARGCRYPDVRHARFSLWLHSKIAVSFFGPPSGNLVLKLTHSSRDAIAVTVLTLKESHGSRTFDYRVSSSLATTNITLFPSPSDHPSFVPNRRNNLIIEVSQGGWRNYVIQDIQLHDEAGNDINAASPEP